jgi:hypothetical protein
MCEFRLFTSQFWTINCCPLTDPGNRQIVWSFNLSRIKSSFFIAFRSSRSLEKKIYINHTRRRNYSYTMKTLEVVLQWYRHWSKNERNMRIDIPYLTVRLKKKNGTFLFFSSLLPLVYNVMIKSRIFACSIIYPNDSIIPLPK